MEPYHNLRVEDLPPPVAASRGQVRKTIVVVGGPYRGNSEADLRAGVEKWNPNYQVRVGASQSLKGGRVL